jgi:hypothetical protein
MLITKDIGNRLVLSDVISFIRKTEDRYYMICEDHTFQRKGVKIQKEFLIETVSNNSAACQKFCLSMNDHIGTIISLLRLKDNITLRIHDCNFDDLTVIEIYLDVVRPSQPVVEYTFLLKTVIETFL